MRVCLEGLQKYDPGQRNPVSYSKERHLYELTVVSELITDRLFSVKVKRGQREGDGTENVTTISDTFPTISGTFTTFPMLGSCDIKAS